MLDDLVTFVDSDVTPTAIAGDTLIWAYDILFSAEIDEIKLQLEIAGVNDIGEVIQLRALNYVGENPDNLALSSHYDFVSEITCAYDPNDKLVNPSRQHEYGQNYTLFDEIINYTVRFQNTGNDTAFTVSIVDEIDEHLDILSLKPISASHPYYVEVDEACSTVTFVFDNILLPDSTTNFDLSNGFINFDISPKEDLAEETLITNEASIFFDFNPPIITNKVNSVLVSELPVINDLQETTSQGGKIIGYPNPFTNGISFEIPDEMSGKTFNLSVHNSLGQLVARNAIPSYTQVFSLELPQLPQGVYHCVFIAENGDVIDTLKVIKN